MLPVEILNTSNDSLEVLICVCKTSKLSPCCEKNVLVNGILHNDDALLLLFRTREKRKLLPALCILKIINDIAKLQNLIY